MPTKQVRFSTALPGDVVAELDRIAEVRGISRNDVIRELVRLGLTVYERQQRVLSAMEVA